MESTYDSIIPKTGAQWPRLHNTHALARLHRKFWGQSMQGEPENKSLNVDWDEDAEEDEEDGIGPGCYILDLGIPDIGRSKLWIRREYIRLYKYYNEYLESRRKEQVPPSVVITGQPGIGERFVS